MHGRSRLLRAAALLGPLLAGAAAPATAAEVRPGGALDLTISGYAGVNAFGGALDNQGQDPDLSTGLDFSSDAEVDLLLEGEDAATGLEYGAAVEFDASGGDENEAGLDLGGEDDDGTGENTGATWVYLRGGWGELRLGDEEGPADESALGADTVAAGTGGIGGDVVEEIAVDAISPTTSDVATKVRYYTPEFGGLQFGVSYTPDGGSFGDTLATTDAEAVHLVEAAVAYAGEWDTFDLEASAVGGVGQERNEGGRGRLWTGYAGATLTVDDLEFGAGFGGEDVAGTERTYLNAGVAYAFDPLAASLTLGRVLRTRGYEGVGEPWSLVLSGTLDLAEGLTFGGDVAYIDNDLAREAREPTGGDSGLVWVTRVEVSF